MVTIKIKGELGHKMCGCSTCVFLDIDSDGYEDPIYSCKLLQNLGLNESRCDVEYSHRKFDVRLDKRPNCPVIDVKFTKED